MMSLQVDTPPHVNSASEDRRFYTAYPPLWPNLLAAKAKREYELAGVER